MNANKITFILIALIILVAFALLLSVAVSADTPYNVFLPFVKQPEQYPSTGWIITARWGNQAQTFFTMTHAAGGWELTGVCIDNQYPAPNVGDACTLVNAIFYCGSSSQRISIVELLVTPTATNTATPTATSTELPTETPAPTLHPPTGITDTPTPDG